MPDTRLTFHHQLDDVQRDLLRAAARVTESITRGTEALLTLDLAEAQAIIDSDHELNELALDIEVTGSLPEPAGASSGSEPG